MKDLTGTTISHYLILDRLSAKNRSASYKAQDKKRTRNVVLKFVTSPALETEGGKARFLNEARVLPRLDHPNIARTYEVIEAEGKCFISRAYLVGKSLKEIIRDKKISIRAALEIAIKIGEGLTAAHRNQIVHGNIKSQNIMLTKEGGIKITDFGMPALKTGSGSNEIGATLSRTQYISPEQARSEQIDGRTDIFSFGVVLYEMITGQLPFRGENQKDIILSLLDENPESLTKYRAEVPSKLQEIVDKLLQKDVALRYQNMDEVLADLTGLKQEFIPKRRLVFRKIRPRYKTILISALIICFIIAVILLMVLNKYLLTPIFEKKGSAPGTRSIGRIFSEEERKKYVPKGGDSLWIHVLEAEQRPHPHAYASSILPSPS